jgi:hypothetical protein
LNAQLAEALRTTKEVNAYVQSQLALDQTIESAIDYWIIAHRGLGWHVYTIDLNLTFNRMSEHDREHINVSPTRKFSEMSLRGTNTPYGLFILEVDEYTPQWVRTAVTVYSAPSNSRILNLIHHRWPDS